MSTQFTNLETIEVIENLNRENRKLKKELRELHITNSLIKILKETQMTKDEESLKDHEIGIKIITVLNLELNKNGFVDTGWGPKTPEGIALCIKRLIYGEI